MSIEILEGNGKAVMYDNSTSWAFGPVMGSLEEAEAFLEYLKPADPRMMEDVALEGRFSEFKRQNVCLCGTVRCTDCDYCDDGQPLVDRHHEWNENGENYKEACRKDPEPAPGESFKCSYCTLRDAKRIGHAKPKGWTPKDGPWL